MAALAYKLLGLSAWRAAKWYLRKRMSVRRLAFTALLAVLGAIASRLADRRRFE